jgi:outer membrane protein OmpA-like peptidoglycan-associated protein
MMVFNSKLTPESNYDIFVSYNENGIWSKPQPFTVLNSTGNDETPYITPDGRIIVFSSDRVGSLRPSRTADGVERITYDVYISYFINENWTPPVPVPGNVNTIHNERTPSITRDGRTIYFSRWRFGAIRESKIMKAENIGGRFINVSELPPPINTGNLDMAFTPTFFGGFFFVSQREEGLGGWDIYYASSDTANADVFNMGRGINSNANDLFLTMSRRNVYLSSDRVGSIGGYSIFCAPIISLHIPNLPVRIEPPTEEPVPIENGTDLPLETDFPLEDEKEPIAEEQHVFENGIEPETPIIVICKDRERALREAAKLRPIYFALDSAEIRKSSIPKLQQVVQFLRKYPDINIRIVGHADESGPAAHNLALSRKRAEAVRRYLTNMGINPNRLETIGFGSTRPVVPKRDRSLDRFNRRVEFEVR